MPSHVAVHLNCEHVGLENNDWFLVKGRTISCSIPTAVYLWFKTKKKSAVDWVGISSWISSEFLRVLKLTLPGVKGKKSSTFYCDKWCKYTLSKQSILTSWTVAFPVTLSPEAKFWATYKLLEPSGLWWILIMKKKQPKTKAECVELVCFLCPFRFPLFFLFPIILLWCPGTQRRQTSCGSPRL